LQGLRGGLIKARAGVEPALRGILEVALLESPLAEIAGILRLGKHRTRRPARRLPARLVGTFTRLDCDALNEFAGSWVGGLQLERSGSQLQRLRWLSLE
jgi:hypothetical protein